MQSFRSENWLGAQLGEQYLRLLQIERVEAFRKPAIDWSKQFASLLSLPLIKPEARRAHGRAQFPGFSFLVTCDRERTLKVGFSLRGIPLRRHQGDFAGYAMDLGLAPLLPGCLHQIRRFVDAAPSLIELAEIRIGALSNKINKTGSRVLIPLTAMR
jgi:hypothetical protein